MDTFTVKNLPKKSGLCNIKGTNLGIKSGCEWSHYSIRSGTLKLRLLGPDFAKEHRFRVSEKECLDAQLADAPFYSSAKIDGLVGGYLKVPASSLPCTDLTSWMVVSGELEAVLKERKAPSPLDTDGEPANVARDRVTLVPTTKLRPLYAFVRDFPEDFVYRMFRDTGDRLASRLGSWFARSVKDFSNYENINEEFVPPERQGKQPERLPDDKFAFARDVVVKIAERNCSIDGEKSDLIYKERELSPYRTTGGQFVGGASAKSSGAGGIDIVLARGCVPVLAEVKSRRDTNPMVALIQLLTYAAEMAPSNQRERLRKHYKVDAVEPMELLLVLQSRGEEDHFLEFTNQLASRLARKEGVGRHIGRIRAIKTTWSHWNAALEFTTAFDEKVR